MDLLFIEAAERIIDYVDERYGRVAAWMTGVVMLIAPLMLVMLAAWWLLSAE